MAIPGNMMPSRVEEFQAEESRRGLGAAATMTWFKSPGYGLRWSYLHRPSVWSSMGDRGVRWTGLLGFRSLFAGNRGMTYSGGERTTISPLNPMGYAIRGAGRGIEAGGRAIGRASIRNIVYPQGIQGMVGQTGFTTNVGWMHKLGSGMERFGAGMRTGGIGGGIAGIGGRATRWGEGIQGIFGGRWYDSIGGYGALNINTDIFNESFITKTFRPSELIGPDSVTRPTWVEWKTNRPRVYADIISTLSDDAIDYMKNIRGQISEGRYGIRSLINPRRDIKNIVTSSTDRDFRRAVLGVERETGAVSRAVRFKAATRIMSGVAVGINVALVGGALATAAHRGIVGYTDAMMRFMQNNTAGRLEFGTGMGFQTSGALTERQRALTAISNSRLSARSALGNEAQLAHENLG